LSDDQIDHSVGIEFLVRLGERIEKGQPVGKLFCPSKIAEYAAELVRLSIGTSPDRIEPPPLIIERIA
jgi:thymidine phosphorylase